MTKSEYREIEKQIKELETEERKIRADRRVYQSSEAFMFGDAIHLKFNKLLDQNIKEQNKLNKMLF